MEIGGLQKTTLIDYPGKIAATVFLIGCNFRCGFCYSGELVLPEKINPPPLFKKKWWGAEKEFFDFLKERQGLLEGICLCGGEPCISKDLPKFCAKIKKMGYLVKLDTNGSFPKMIEKLIQNNLIDYVAMDIKAPLKAELNFQFSIFNFQTNSKFKNKYEQMTGVEINIEDIKKSVELLKQGKIDFEFRTTVAPGLTEQDLLKIADWIKGKKVKYFFQEFNTQKPVLNPKILKYPILKEEEIQEIVKNIKPKFQTCKLR